MVFNGLLKQINKYLWTDSTQYNKENHIVLGKGVHSCCFDDNKLLLAAVSIGDNKTRMLCDKLKIGVVAI